LPYFTIVKIARGEVKDPRISTIQRLLDHFAEAA
jgi:predicted transcriptional regulator